MSTMMHSHATTLECQTQRPPHSHCPFSAEIIQPRLPHHLCETCRCGKGRQFRCGFDALFRAVSEPQ